MSIKTIAAKEFKSILKEKTLLLMFLIQLFIASFAAFLVVGIFSYLSPEALEGYLPDADLAVVTADEEHELIGYLAEKKGIRLHVTQRFDDAVKAFYEGKVDGILVLPEEKASGVKPIKFDLYLPKMDIKATVIAAALKRPIERYEASVRKLRAQRLPPEFRGALSFDLELPPSRRMSSYYEFVYGILIPLLVIAPALISGGLVIDLLTEEMEKKTMQMLLASPLSLRRILDGKILVASSIAPFQSLLWMFLLEFNGIEILNKWAIFVFVAALALFLVACGSIISLIYGRRGAAHFIYSLLLLNLFFASLAFHWVSPFGVITKLALDVLVFPSSILFMAYFLAALAVYSILKLRFAKMELKVF